MSSKSPSKRRRSSRHPALRREPLPGRWRERVVLDDGRELVLRPIEPSDAPALQAGFALLDADEVRMRFMHSIKELSPEMAERLTRIDRRRAFALVAAEPLPPGEALVGAVVRASLDDEGRRAEFAILVPRLLAGQGLGGLLMRRLLHWARLKRLDEVYGDVLEENTPMLRLARSLGFEREHRDDEPGVVRIRLPLRAQALAA